MIRVTVELIPGEHEERKILLSQMQIENISGNDERWPDFGDYSVQVVTDQGDISLQQRTFKNFPRLKYNVWALILQALATFNHKDLILGEDHDVSGQEPHRKVISHPLRGISF